MKRSFLITLLLSVLIPVTAQIYDPVSWRTSLKMDDETHGTVVMMGRIQQGWHVYGMNISPNLGPTPLSVTFSTLKGVKLDGSLTPDKAPTVHHDPAFNADLPWWKKTVKLRQKFTVTARDYTIAGTIRYGACNEETKICTPPAKEAFELSGTAPSMPVEKVPEPKDDKGKETDEAKVEDTPEEASDTIAADTIATDSVAPAVAGDPDTWAPVKFDKSDNSDDMSTSSLWYIFAMCFLGGLLALFTPCVWPMIPLTVSFFLKKSANRAKAVGDALTYGASIVVIYVVLGMAISIIFGADTLNTMATSAVCNIIFFLLLVVFAISFFGAFEIKLPDKWGNSMDSHAEKTTGLLSIFFMAFTLALVSFSCTGPIIGTLLVEAATTGDKFGPAIGMLGFSLALAIPFALFALFPGWLQRSPRSGGWMNTIKVVLGFLELALSLKFLSVADLAYGWHILDRETFLALWIVIFGLLGFYLLGRFNFSHYGDAEGSVGVTRFMLALVSLSFTVYLIPGLWGAPLKSVSAFVPPLYTQDLNLYARELQKYDDYDAAIEASRRDGKPIFIDFSGYGCVNCRKMEAAVLDRDEVHAMLGDNFINVTLMTDDRTPLKEPVEVNENGKKIVLETVGEKWSYFQRVKFNTNAQPYYVVVDGNGNLLSGPFAYDENAAKFVRFLEDGIEKYKAGK